MKQLAWFFTCALVLGASPLSAAQFKLTHSVEPLGVASKYVQLTNAAPAGVAMPELKARTVFGFWPVAGDTNGGRWFCITATKPKATLYFDANGDNRLADEKPVVAVRASWSSIDFDPMPVVLHYGTTQRTYHVAVQMWNVQFARVQSASVYKGVVTFGTAKQNLELWDYNVNGRFSDLYESGKGADVVVIGSGEARKQVRLGKYIEYRNQLYRVEVAADGSTVAIEPATDVKWGELALAPGVTELELVGANGEFTRRNPGASIRLPEGTYDLDSWAVQKRDSKGVVWVLECPRGAGTVSVSAAQTNRLVLPDAIHVSLKYLGQETAGYFIASLTNEFAETLIVYKDRARTAAVTPALVIKSTDGKYAVTNDFRYG